MVTKEENTMSTSTVVEVLNSPELAMQRKQLFACLDTRAREIEKQTKETWVELANLCCTIRDNELWREGEYQSFGSWLKDACPTSRSYAYMTMGIRDELREIPDTELKQIPLGNADIMKSVPKALRSAPEVLDKAKRQQPQEFINTAIQAAPDAHLEKKLVHRLRFTASQSKVFAEGCDMWRVVNDDPSAPVEDVIEGIIADYVLSHQREFDKKAR